MTEQEKYEMIDAWVEKNKPKRYKHGERPEGQEPPGDISVWRKRKKTAAEKQAEKDALGEY